MSYSDVYKNFSMPEFVKELWMEEFMMEDVLQCIRTVLESNYSFLVIFVLVNLVLILFMDFILMMQISRRNPLYRNWISLAGQILVSVGFYSSIKSITLFPTNRLESFEYNLLCCICFPLSTAFSYDTTDLNNAGIGNALFFWGLIFNFCYLLPDENENIVSFWYVVGSQMHTVGSAIKIFNFQKTLPASEKTKKLRKVKSMF